MRQKGTMFAIILTIILLGGSLYGICCLFLYLMQARLLYYPNVPSRELTATPSDIGMGYESVSIVTSDGVTLHGWFVPAAEEKGVLLFFHGNAGNISHRLDSLRIFHEIGLTTLIIDYRGYGRSQGKISEPGTYLDAEAAWNYLTGTKHIGAEKIVIFGRSLGGAIAAYTASRHLPGGLMLESVFTSVPDLAARLYPVFPVRLLSRFEYDVRKTVRDVRCPVLVIHSPDDEIIPFEHGRQLYGAASEPKSFLAIRGGHNEGFLVSRGMYSEGIRNFLTRCLADPRAAPYR